MAWLAIPSMNYDGFVLVMIGIVGILASLYYRRVVKTVGSDDALSLKVGWYRMWMVFGFFMSIMFIVAGILISLA